MIFFFFFFVLKSSLPGRSRYDGPTLPPQHHSPILLHHRHPNSSLVTELTYELSGNFRKPPATILDLHLISSSTAVTTLAPTNLTIPTIPSKSQHPTRVPKLTAKASSPGLTPVRQNSGTTRNSTGITNSLETSSNCFPTASRLSDQLGSTAVMRTLGGPPGLPARARSRTAQWAQQSAQKSTMWIRASLPQASAMAPRVAMWRNLRCGAVVGAATSAGGSSSSVDMRAVSSSCRACLICCWSEGICGMYSDRWG
ncbi:1-phosphatidylinositol-4-phosphate 5-kinases [Striga asiatica]|uniref:1-phosphatidylinositol-4-phosphate 5-kinases n=1 Tax=Striga asiatica TaxID=4170 RepID=A0A5A7RHB2_STRAF|nr:1-phosphatidylinositol-4-phosphate 5-kinases [Striga asiatica]